MNIAWEDDLLPPLKTADDSDILALEAVLGVKLPDDYVDILKDHQGQSPVNYIVSNDALAGVPLSPLFHVSIDKKHPKYTESIMYYWKKWKDWYPKLVPFAGTGGGASMFAFDFKDPVKPCVVFIDANLSPDDPDSVFFCADSFSSLLCDLKGDDELDL